MKSKTKILYTFLGALVLLAFGCNNKLDEHPFTVFSTEYFKTVPGIQNAVNALYSGLRYDFGPEGAVAVTNAGTDEWNYADQVRSASQQGDVLTLGKYTLDNANGAITTPWNRNYNNINLANAVIAYAPSVTFSQSPATDSTTRNVLLGEAHFLRAQYYMLLVSQFGAVPVDLGSGDLQFNQTPFQGFNRLPVTDILKKDYNAIIADLIFATQHLPVQRPAAAFRLAQPAAYALLAKAYLYRAYTSSVSQATDFQNAYNAAIQIINNQGTYNVALQAAYGTVHKPGNDYNSEILYSCERLPGNNDANEYNNPSGIGGTKGVDASNDFNPDYTSVVAPLASSTAKPCGTRFSLYGRPIRRFCPTAWLYNVAFADKDNDSRYDGTFRTMWRATVTTTAGGITWTNNATNQDLSDTVTILAKTNQIADSINAIVPHKNYRIIAPREFYFFSGFSGQNIYPALSKYEDPNKQNFNDEGGRPFPVLKLSDVYLMAAEAAFKLGNLAEAAKQINVLKLRAANRINLGPNDIKDIVKRSPLGAGAVSGTALSANEITRRYAIIKTADDGSQITLDFIMDERTRELCGESVRWPDLAVRGMLVQRVQAYNPDGGPNIKSYHVLRPIPKSELDAISDPNKTLYQNPGY